MLHSGNAETPGCAFAAKPYFPLNTKRRTQSGAARTMKEEDNGIR